MTSSDQLVAPADIRGINALARSWSDPETTIHPVEIERIVIEDDAIDALVEEVRSAAGHGRTALVVDRTPMKRGSDDLKPLLLDSLGRVTRLTVRHLPAEPAGEFHADLPAVRRLGEELRDYDVVVAAGSGTIVDAVKYARHLAVASTGVALPFICFPTAASVTAYTSSLAALTVDGVKRTLPARPPDVIICDLRTLAAAPRIMTQAGFADVIARGVSHGDWFLAYEIGMDDHFSQVPARLLEDAERAMIESAAQVATGRIDAVRKVMEAGLLAGMAMSLVNQTAPLSGWEHVMSHFFDLTADHDDRRVALHGGQVGVATLVSALAYERDWKGLDTGRLRADISKKDEREYRERIECVFGRYDPSGKLAAEVWTDFSKKIARWRAASESRKRFVDRYRAGELDAPLRQAVRSSAEIDDALKRAGAPRRFDELDKPIPAATARAAIRHAHLLRARFTLGDLLDRGGRLTDEAGGELLAALDRMNG